MLWIEQKETLPMQRWLQDPNSGASCKLDWVNRSLAPYWSAWTGRRWDSEDSPPMLRLYLYALGAVIVAAPMPERGIGHRIMALGSSSESNQGGLLHFSPLDRKRFYQVRLVSSSDLVRVSAPNHPFDGRWYTIDAYHLQITQQRSVAPCNFNQMTPGRIYNAGVAHSVACGEPFERQADQWSRTFMLKRTTRTPEHATNAQLSESPARGDSFTEDYGRNVPLFVDALVSAREPAPTQPESTQQTKTKPLIEQYYTLSERYTPLREFIDVDGPRRRPYYYENSHGGLYFDSKQRVYYHNGTGGWRFFYREQINAPVRGYQPTPVALGGRFRVAMAPLFVAMRRSFYGSMLNKARSVASSHLFGWETHYRELRLRSPFTWYGVILLRNQAICYWDSYRDQATRWTVDQIKNNDLVATTLRLRPDPMAKGFSAALLHVTRYPLTEANHEPEE